MTTAVLVSSALAGADTRYTWTWAFGSDQATASSWPADTGGGTAALTPSGALALGQPTGLFDALGAGSARIDNAVLCGASGRYLSAAAYANPAAQAVWMRLVFFDVRHTGTATYLELGQAAQRFTIRRSGDDLVLVANLGDHTETVPGVFALLDDGPALLDVISGAGGFTVYLNGVDLSPLLTGAALSAFAGAAQLALLNNLAGTDAAREAYLLFAGLKTGGGCTFAQHRTDAYLYGALFDGLAVDNALLETDDWWSWSPARAELSGAATVLVTEQGEGGTLTLATAPILGSTAALRPEGLGRIRTARALDGIEAEVVSPSGAAAVDGDLRVRLIFRVDSSPAESVPLFVLEDDESPALRFEVAVDSASGDLTLTAPSGYAVTAVAAVVLDAWHLLDVSLDRDGDGGNALLIGRLDGADLGLAGHGSTVSDIPAGARVALLDGSPAGGSLAFAAVGWGQLADAAEHDLAAAALGVL